MATQKKKIDDALWFLTDHDSPKIEEIQSAQHVNLAYSDPKSQKYVSVSGVAHEVRDREIVKELWNPMYKAWFPNGPEDPNVVALRVDVESAEYWDAPNNKIVYAIGLAKAAMTGQRYEGEGSEHGKMTFS
jgi:general stress protein 26